MRIRIWIFAGLVALVLAINLGLVSLRIAQTGEDTVRGRVALATSALKGQLELIDARLVPRAVATLPELIEATRPPSDPTQPLGRPDEKALRAAASALSPEPDLLAVVSAQGGIVSRRAKPAQPIDDVSKLPLGRAALEANRAPGFATWDGATYRVASARIPGNAAAVLDGTLVDDRLAAQLKSQIDADVTLIQGGKVLASSLPQGEDRVRVLRWSAAPAPGYGVLQVQLPGAGNAFSGKLPRGASRYAVRGALVPLDSGVQAALTVPASPYLGWLARYQAFYLLGLLLFIVFGLLWGLLARAALAKAQAPSITPAPPRSRPSLLGTDVGEPRDGPPPPGTRNVPWSAGEGPSGEHAVLPALQPPRLVESLDPELPGAHPPAEHPMWSADPFTPTPEQFAVDHPPGESDGAAASAPASPDSRESSAAKGDFSFAGLLDEARASTAQVPDAPHPGEPSPSLLAESRGDGTLIGYAGYAAGPGPAPEYFPGDEPTRIEPLSAALLDKLREKDEAQPEANVTLQDFTLPVVADEDPDEQHWRETFDKYKELKTMLGEPADRISFEKFSAKLRKNRGDLLAKHQCKAVRFSAYEKDGKASIKASAVR